jgi:S1-C subfamily serine protease
MNKNLETYIGLADCHGLSSFLEDSLPSTSSFTNTLLFGGEESEEMTKKRSAMLHGMQLSAYHNNQRRTVVYQAKVTKEVADEIKELMQDGEILDALIVLKDRATEIGLLQGVPNAKKFWEQIPNPDLDPFH